MLCQLIRLCNVRTIHRIWEKWGVAYFKVLFSQSIEDKHKNPQDRLNMADERKICAFI